MTIKVGASGVYSAKVIRNAGTEKEYIEDCGEHHNMLLDGFFPRWLDGTVSTSNAHIHVGTGSTEVLATQTQLISTVASQAASSSSNNNEKIGTDYFMSRTFTATFALGAVVGNIAEVGFSHRSNSAATNIDSRALVVDDVGTPTPITVTSNDQLIMSYTLRLKIPVAQHVSSHTFDGVVTTCTLETLGALSSSWNYNYLMQSAGVYLDNPRISDVQELVNNVEGSATAEGISVSVGSTSSVVGSAKRVTKSASINQANNYSATGIKYASFGYLGIHFDPPLFKTDQKTMTWYFDFTLARE